MKTPESSVFALREALVLPHAGAFPSRVPPFWKIFTVFLLLSFSLVAFPGQAAVEQSLNAESLLALVNADRTREGLTPLVMDARLRLAAEAKARHLLANGYFAHYSPDGVKPWDFIKSVGFAYSFAGENLALNYTNSYELEKDFLGSPEHRDNLLSPLYSQTGIAVVSGIYKGEPAVVTVQMFASPASKPVAIK